eukprot:TRINITY_DN5646_c0_g1_i1.p1 TRINITY_DN5646_c0_g1~~TRINITY_DN5646_c0_g1_i1.p1  ORF type:complete len:242 (+),score=48.97 TRINITY_DN5646_c0_g1_i1:102-827(+)
MASHKGLVIITGASSGIGEATAKLLSSKGYALLLIGRRLDRMEALNLPHSLSKKVDVLDLESFSQAVTEAESRFGPTLCLINNAGVMLLGKTESQKTEEWSQMLDVNVKGVLNGCKLVLKGMYERQKGTIINISSIAGRKTFPDHSVYCATKFAVHSFSEALREEASEHNVRVVIVAPGVVETELLGHTTDNKIIEGYSDWKKTFKVLESIDIARCIEFALEMPEHVCVRELLVGPTKQKA